MMFVFKIFLDKSNISVIVLLTSIRFFSYQLEIFLILGMRSDCLKLKLGHFGIISLDLFKIFCSSRLPLILK